MSRIVVLGLLSLFVLAALPACSDDDASNPYFISFKLGDTDYKWSEGVTGYYGGNCMAFVEPLQSGATEQTLKMIAYAKETSRDDSETSDNFGFHVYAATEPNWADTYDRKSVSIDFMLAGANYNAVTISLVLTTGGNVGSAYTGIFNAVLTNETAGGPTVVLTNGIINLKRSEYINVN